MNRTRRAVAAALLMFMGVVGLAAPAGAQVLPAVECGDEMTVYSPGGVCDVQAELVPVCAGSLSALTYDVAVEGASAKAVTLTWVNPSGDDLVVTDLPLAGSTPWPGTTTGGADWAKPDVEVRVAVDGTDAEVVSTVSYPGDSPECAPELASSGGGPETGQVSTGGFTALSATGSTLTPLALIAGTLVLGGAATFVVARRRHTA